MSWDVVLFSSSERITSVEDLDETKLIPTNFASAFNDYFKTIKKDKNYWDIKGTDFEICFYPDEEPTSNTMLNLYGEDALFEVITLAIKNNWQIFDTSIGEMIDLNDPSKNGFKNFQNYLNHILINKN